MLLRKESSLQKETMHLRYCLVPFSNLMYIRMREAASWLLLKRLVPPSPNIMSPPIHFLPTTTFGAKIQIRLVWPDNISSLTGSGSSRRKRSCSLGL